MNTAAFLDDSPEGLLARGLIEFSHRNFVDAVRCFERAASQAGIERLPANALAAYSVSLAKSQRARSREAVKLCRHAVKKNPVDTQLYRCLAEVYLLARSRQGAVEALHEGLRVDPHDGSLRRRRTELGLRRPRIIPFLSRSNPLNRMLGMLRHRFRGKRAR